MSARHVEVTLRRGAKWVVLNNPKVRNAFNNKTIQQLREVFTTINPAECRAVVVTGAERIFSAGADLNWMKSMLDYTATENYEDARLMFQMFNAMYNCPVPVIARVNGDAMGGGVGLVAACDFAFALNRCRFGFTECKLGLVPAVISPFVVSKIGKCHASRYFLTAERFNSAEAVRIGLVQQSFEAEEELDAAVESALNEIRANGPTAVRTCKQLLGTVSTTPITENALPDYLCRTIADIRVSPEGQEGLKSFLEKKKPSWQEIIE
eukprot:TRINITY_DN67346_c0_g1_i1.p1 TRINITY_DN67346_c0_g1~~TRINITY_DN67346_c0_g1_i1.p1  ORF type:complete len:266 (-),score=35.80 TRINITY_DN67346_c0_g1_i1:140-937(-)